MRSSIRCVVAVGIGTRLLATATGDDGALERTMKAQRGYTHGEAPAETLRYVSIKLKPGWGFDPSRGQFVAAGGRRLSVRDQLPKDSEIVPTVPALAKVDPAKLSDAERDLARHYRLILPKGEAPARYLPVVKRWEPVEEATLPPQVSLP
jgi:hypothetical protein